MIWRIMAMSDKSVIILGLPTITYLLSPQDPQDLLNRRAFAHRAEAHKTTWKTGAHALKFNHVDSL